MTALPRITIVTPSFNQGEFLGEAIESVLSQGYGNLEYIVMDGGSTDSTGAVLDRYRDRLAHCVSEPDDGQSDALIRGFARATGEIFGWLCADDVLLPGSLERVAASCPADGWLVGGACVMDASGSMTDVVRHGRYRRGDVLYNSYVLNQVSVFWSAELYRSVRGIERGLHYAMDYDLWTQFERRAAPVVIPDLLGAFRLHGAQKTADSRATWEEIWQVRARHLRARPVRRLLGRGSWFVRRLAARGGIGPGVGHEYSRP